MKQTKIILASLSLAAALLLAACSNSTSQEPAASSFQATSSQMSESTTSTSGSTSSPSMTSSSDEAATSSSQTQASDLDGTYKGMDGLDQVTLEIKGNEGTWTKLEADGEQEVKPVSLDPTAQRIYIGDDVERYLVDGATLTIEDLDQDDEKDTVVLTKQ